MYLHDNAIFKVHKFSGSQLLSSKTGQYFGDSKALEFKLQLVEAEALLLTKDGANVKPALELLLKVSTS